MGALLTWMAAQGLSTLKFSLPNGLQKSVDTAAFLGSQYVVPAIEANLPLSMNPTIWMIAPLTTAVICGILGLWRPNGDCRGRNGIKFALD